MDPSVFPLTTMLTPTVLISAAGTLIFSTSARLQRAMDRVRHLIERYRQLVKQTLDEDDRSEQQLIVLTLPRLMRRVRLIQASLASFYFSVCLLVVTSVVIGWRAVLRADVGPYPTWLALAGAVALGFGASLLVIENRISVVSIMSELAFVERIRSRYASPSEPPIVPRA